MNTSPLTEKATRIRFSELESYRGLAAIGIIAYHAYQSSRVSVAYVYEESLAHLFIRNLDAGVSLFFVLSGFIISLPYIQSALTLQKPISSKSFLLRRLIRIVPLYYIATLLVWCLRYSSGNAQWIDLIEHLTFTQIFDNSRIFWTIGPAWSLSVELIFYLLIAVLGPLLYKLSTFISSAKKRAILLFSSSLLLIIISLAYKWWAFVINGWPETAYSVYYGPLAKLDTFALGMVLATIWNCAGKKPKIEKTVQFLLFFLGMETLGVAFLLRPLNNMVDLYFNTVTGVGFFMMLAATIFGNRQSLIQRILSNKYLQFLGIISYSVYLWHEPLLLFLERHSILVFSSPGLFPISVILLLLLSVGIGVLSYFGIEKPMMLLKNIFDEEGNLQNHYT